MPGQQSATIERAFIARVFASRIRESDLGDLLRYLNGLADYRFTGVYRFSTKALVPIALYDRVSQTLDTVDGEYEQASAHVGVLLRDTTGVVWGTLCHFDFVAHPAQPEALAQLRAVRPLIEEMFVRDQARFVEISFT